MTEEDDRLASEYVIGILDAEAVASCELRLARDPAFASQVEGWRQRFAELDQTAPAEPPTPMLWARIEATIATARPPAQRTPRLVPSRLSESAARLWNDLPIWRGVGLLATASAVLMAIGIAVLVRENARSPVLVAVLLSDQSRPAAIVNAFRDGRTELVPLQAITAPEGKTLQVWTLWDKALGPVSVGLLDALRSVDLSVGDLPAPAVDQLFEVTLEPTGGSPTGRPTGPILMKGTTSRTDIGT